MKCFDKLFVFKKVTTIFEDEPTWTFRGQVRFFRFVLKPQFWENVSQIATMIWYQTAGRFWNQLLSTNFENRNNFMVDL